MLATFDDVSTKAGNPKHDTSERPVRTYDRIAPSGFGEVTLNRHRFLARMGVDRSRKEKECSKKEVFSVPFREGRRKMEADSAARGARLPRSYGRDSGCAIAPAKDSSKDRRGRTITD